MPRGVIQLRARYFIAVEGQSEQAFVRWLQELSETKLHIHLDAVVLNGGGFKSMLNDAVRQHARRSQNGHYKHRFLIVDGDRAEQGDWSIDTLRQQATKCHIEVFVQNPNHEGLLLRMAQGMENEIPVKGCAGAKLKKLWPSYCKPANARELGRQFTLDDLLHVARLDTDLQNLLKKIGLMQGP